jgi:hypothetical protein
MNLAAQLPVIFGFTIFDSIRTTQDDGMITFPCPMENTIGGHAVVAVGYDDDIQITSACGKRPRERFFFISRLLIIEAALAVIQVSTLFTFQQRVAFH